MKFSEKWLREWVNPAVSSTELVAQLTMAGLEVDALEPVAAEFSGVVIGHVLNLTQHPDADRLRVCEVDVGQPEPLQIVCGAANVFQGARVPAALIGAVLPCGLKIKRGKLRGVESFGMLCSAKELGIAETSEGLLILPQDAPVGQDVRQYLQLDDYSIDVDLTPNRSDCLSIAGIAREVGVLNSFAVNANVVPPVPAASAVTLSVAIQAPIACPRYVGRVISGINPESKTPLWMQERLRRSGLRTIHPVVDVTNYVMLELGQPMHGFDLSRLEGGIQVRMAVQGESLVLLDGKALTLEADTLVIADHARPLALAGIMGGQDSGVTESTRDVFLESAFFAPQSLAGKARRYGLHTDSSHRFERGVSPDLQRQAIERATQLLQDIVGGQAGPVIEKIIEDCLPERATILLRRGRINRVLGLELDDTQIEDILQRLGMVVARCDEGWQVTAPGFRFDIAIEVDLIEELGRVYGYSNLPVSRPMASLLITPQAETQVPVDRLRTVLIDRGYQEAITYSFVDINLQALLDPEQTPIALANPISSDMAVMRTNLWPGLVKTMQYNLSRQQGRVRIFETGLRYRKVDGIIAQHAFIAGLVYGSVTPEQWGEGQRGVDFFDIKADVEALLAQSGCKYSVVADEHSALHPGQSAKVMKGDMVAGWMGALHPVVQKALDVTSKVYVFELDLAAITAGELPGFAEVSKFPAIRRDIAVVLDDSVCANDVCDCIIQTSPAILQDLQLFDMYKGKGVESGKKSLALSLVLQDHSRTLTDDEVEAVITNVVAVLGSRFNAKLRD